MAIETYSIGSAGRFKFDNAKSFLDGTAHVFLRGVLAILENLTVTANATMAALTLTGTLKTEAGRIVNTTRVTGNTTLNNTHHKVYVDTDGGAVIITLPAGVDGTEYSIYNVGSNNNKVTVTPDGSELLDGANNSKTLDNGSVVDLTYETIEGWR